MTDKAKLVTRDILPFGETDCYAILILLNELDVLKKDMHDSIEKDSYQLVLRAEQRIIMVCDAINTLRGIE